MGSAIRFDGPTGQQQSQNDTENQLFLFRQAVHMNTITETGQTATMPFTIYDLRFTIEKTSFAAPITNQKSKTIKCMAAIGRFQKSGEIFYAKVVDGELFRLRGDVFGSPVFDRRPTARKGVKTLVPVVPSKVIAVGLNYIEHARETGKPLPRQPLFWLKAATSLLPDGGKIEIPFPHHRTDYEAELAIVIGRKIRNVTVTMAARYIFGYTTAQDISDRTIQNAESQWTRCKSFDTFTPLGPFVETKLDPRELTIQLFQNGQLRQNSNTSQLVFKPAELVSFISTNLTLLPGDVILTGTPSGIGPIQSGDKLEVRIEGLAPLVNTVK
jgi:2-keto-4-pentenoate hydratase/2-oxohepta-3-ene-1,7-dioic acid hydratase in catechol pathway